MGQEVSVYRFEYEILPNMNPWNVYLASFNPAEAAAHLQKVVNKPIRITSTTLVCRLDDLSGEVRNNVVQAFLSAQGKSKPAAEVKVEDKPVKEEKVGKK